MEDDFKTLNIHGQWQPSSVPQSSEFDQIFSTILPSPVNMHNDDYDIDTLINAASAPFGDFITDQTAEQSDSAVDDLTQQIMDLIGTYDPQDPGCQNDFTQILTTQTSEISIIPPNSVPVGSSPSEGQADDYTLIANQIALQQHQMIARASKSKRRSKIVYHPSTTVGPVEINQNNLSSCRPYTTERFQYESDLRHQQQQLQFDATDPKKIEIKCQPRPKFRPRTQNERKNGSHYLRCVEGVYPEYPTIYTNEKWALHSAENYIEVQLVGLDGQPHPYVIDNKTRHSPPNPPDSLPLIIKQADAGPLYFRLTQEDFQNGFKSFQIELIKSRQDDVITKELIRTRQLDQSRLRFTRIFLDEHGQHLRDECTETFSDVMTEAYGDVAVEHSGPQIGSMAGGEMMYIVLKGRILKMELKIIIVDETLGWRHDVTDFTKNGNVVHFKMPPFPVPEVRRAKCNIILLYKQDELERLDYAYEATIDQMMAELDLGQPTGTAVGTTSDSFDPYNFLTVTGAASIFSSTRKTSTPKSKKRLSDTKTKN